ATASTAITVNDADRAPVVTVPGAVSVSEASPLAIQVEAADPDGEPLASLVADLSGLPPGATFTPGADKASGTPSWTPTFPDAGPNRATFPAANALSASASTVITVADVDRPPAITVPAAVSVPESRTLSLTVHAADPDAQLIDPLRA